MEQQTVRANISGAAARVELSQGFGGADAVVFEIFKSGKKRILGVNDRVRLDVWRTDYSGSTLPCKVEADTNRAVLSVPIRLTERTGNFEAHLRVFNEYDGTIEEALLILAITDGEA